MLRNIEHFLCIPYLQWFFVEVLKSHDYYINIFNNTLNNLET